MNNIPYQRRLEIVQHYLKSGGSLRKTAQKFQVSYRAVFKWVKLYKKHGEEGLLSVYKNPWNKISKELEEKIVLLKEQDLALSASAAKKVLKNDNVNISMKGILGIWQRFGYAGFEKKHMTEPFTDYCIWTKEAKKKFDQAKEIYNLGNIKKTAEILNSIPILPKNEIILNIPDSLLNIRRRIEKQAISLRKISLKIYLKNVRKLYQECKRKKLYYSALRVGILEVVALSWSAEPIKQQKKTKELMNLLKKKNNYYSYLLFAPWFSLLISEGMVYANFLKIKKASEIARTCRALLKRRKDVSPSFLCALGHLYSHMGEYTKAEYWYLKASDNVDKGEWENIKLYLAYVFLHRENYKKAIDILKNIKLPGWVVRSELLYYQAVWNLHRGMPHKAISLSAKALSLLKKEQIRAFIFKVYLTIASSYCCLGENVKAKNILERLLPFLTKNKLKREEVIFRILLYRTMKHYNQLDARPLPNVKLMFLLNRGKYWSAYKYAEKKGMPANFHTYISFFPEVVKSLLERGRSTGLAKNVLRLPIFNREVPVYHVNFLGNVVIYKNQKYLRAKLQPKESAFLIHIALRAREPYKKISLESLYKNFWRKSINPSSNLSHLLTRIKKELRISPHLLEVSYKKDEHVLINKGIYFTSDYDEFTQVLTQAKAFQKAGEGDFAKREFLVAFSLIREAPFNKMYDPWSEDMRSIILNKFENEVINFVRVCMMHNDYQSTKKILAKASKIVRYSKQIEKIRKKLGLRKYPYQKAVD